MCPNYPALVALFSSLLTPALADLVTDVTVNGTVSGTGMVGVRCDSCVGGFGIDNFSFLGLNTGLGAFSKSGQASFTDVGGRSATAFGLSEQTTTVSPTSVSVDIELSAILSGIGGQWSAQEQLGTSYTLGFTLTTASLINLTISGGLPWSLDFPPPLLVDGLVVANPGRYNVVFGDNQTFGASPMGLETQVEQTEVYSFRADFTPVPEPMPITILPASLLMLGHLFLRRRRDVHPSRPRPHGIPWPGAS